MRVLAVKVGEKPQVIEMANELKEFQKFVGGYIEAFPTGIRNVVGICDEEGKLKGYEPNRYVNEMVINGDFFFCGINKEGEFISLTDDEIKKATDICGNENNEAFAKELNSIILTLLHGDDFSLFISSFDKDEEELER